MSSFVLVVKCQAGCWILRPSCSCGTSIHVWIGSLTNLGIILGIKKEIVVVRTPVQKNNISNTNKFKNNAVNCYIEPPAYHSNMLACSLGSLSRQAVVGRATLLQKQWNRCATGGSSTGLLRLNKLPPTGTMTKIVCTIGPATDDASQIGHLVTHGMHVARLNFSHAGSDYTYPTTCMSLVRHAHGKH